MRLKAVAFVVLLGIGLGGCQTIFDYGPPNIDTDLKKALTPPKTGNPDPVIDAASLHDDNEVAEAARLYKEFYAKWAENVSASIQFFEVPILGLGIASGVNLAGLGATKGALTQMLVSAASIATMENYYSPRARRDIYLAGHDAMECVERTARTLDRDRAHHSSLNFAALAAVAPSEDARLTLSELDSIDRDSVTMMVDAMSEINLRMVKRGTDASTQPDASKIATDLKKAVQQNADLDARRPLVASAFRGMVRDATQMKQLAMFEQEMARTASDVIESNLSVDLSKLDADLKVCVAKAG